MKRFVESILGADRRVFFLFSLTLSLFLFSFASDAQTITGNWTANPTTYSGTGQVIDFTMTFNTGSRAWDSVSVSDASISLTGLTCTPAFNNATGVAVTCHAFHTTNATDVSNLQIQAQPEIVIDGLDHLPYSGHSPGLIQVNYVAPTPTPTATPANTAPIVTAGGNQNSNEGASTSFTIGSFVDPDGGPWTRDVQWGDSGGQSNSVNSAGSLGTLSHTYVDNGTYTVTVTVTDSTGLSDVKTFLVTVSNVAPSGLVLNLSSGTINENGSTSLSGSFTDPGTADTHQVTIVWGDGSANTVLNLGAGVLTIPSTSHTYLDDNPTGTASDIYSIGVTVADNFPVSTSGSTPVTVNNVAPSALSLNLTSSTINENGSTSLSGSFADPGSLDTHTVTINWGDGSSNTVLNLGAGVLTIPSTPHTYLDDNPSGTSSDIYSIGVTVADDDLGSASGSTPVTVNNVAPASLLFNLTSSNISENGSTSLSGTFTDPGTLDPHLITINWGDGTAPVSFGVAPGVLAFGPFSHTYLDDDPSGTSSDNYTVGVTVADDDLGSVSGSTTVTVNNVAPASVTLNLTSSTINEGQSTSLSGSFTDPGTLDPHLITINWGDGTAPVSFGVAPGILAFGPFSHTYLDDNPTGTSSDVYTIGVTVADDDLGSGSNSTSVTVNNVAPTATLSNGGPYVFGQAGGVSFSGQADPSAADLAGLRYSYDFDNNGTWEVGSGTYAGSAGTTATAVVPASFILSVGPHVVKGRVMDDDLGVTDYTTTILVDKANTTTVLTSSANGSVWGQSVTFTATISVTAPGVGTPTGNVTFKDGPTTICAAAAVAANVATCTTSSLIVGSHPMTATYNGDGSFNASTGTLTQLVAKSNTTTIVTSSLNPSVYGQAVTMTATVAPAAPGAGTVTGTVSFTFDGNSVCPNTPVAAGQAQCVMFSLVAGTHTIGAVYSGDGNFNGSSGALSQVVNKAATTTTITNAAALAGQTNVGTSYPVNFAVAVTSPGSGTPTGTVTVADGTGATCTASVAAGTCNLPSLTVGAKSITATYGGDANFLTSASTPAVTTHTVVVTISGNIQSYVAGGPNTNLAGVSVALAGTNTPGTTTTDASGNYSFTGVFTGNYLITPNPATPSPGKTYDPFTRNYQNVLANVTGANFIAYVTPGPVPRQLRAVNQYITAGQTATVPLILSSLGNEVSNAFSLSFDTNVITGVPTVVCGSAAPGCAITLDTSLPGKLGITIVPTAGYTTGDREIARVTFQTVANSAPNTPVAFGLSPTGILAKDASNNPLPVTYVSGFIVFQQNLESDVSGRSTGNGDVDATDVTIVRQLVVGCTLAPCPPDPNFNEFQRADSAPAGSKGDGQLDSTDVIQARKYAARIDTPTAAGGPVVPNGPIAPPASASIAGGRTMRAGSVNTSPGNRITIPVELDTKGDEVAASFTLSFDPAKLQNPTITLGDGAEAGTVLTTNTQDAANGRITVLVDGNSLAKQLISVTFDVAETAPSGDTRISFANDPTPSVISNADGDKLTTGYENGTVTITGPNTSGLEISGRVLTPDGRGLRNARVTIIDRSGLTRTATTGAFGSYTFDGVAQGGTYTIAVISRQFRFASRTVQVDDNLTDIDFTGQE